MEIIKSGSVQECSGDFAVELEAINSFAKAKLSAEDIYTFSVLLCDNEVDRDFERFSERTLEELRELFIGKTGICDHEWKCGGQFARIYRTELVKEAGRKNSTGKPYVYLKGYAYMLRTEGNSELIAQIEGGIKRETSVGCSVAESLCSICGEELGGVSCSHIKGRAYNGRCCHAELTGAVDAYEWSFVAVPAQREAGVMKKLGQAGGLKGFVESGGTQFSGELESLEKAAALGRRYLSELRAEVLRLGLLCDRSLHAAIGKSSGRMDEAELLELKKSFEGRLAEKFPPVTQLPGRSETTAFEGGEYLV